MAFAEKFWCFLHRLKTDKPILVHPLFLLSKILLGLQLYYLQMNGMRIILKAYHVIYYLLKKGNN
jgi:hypothetical protein